MKKRLFIQFLFTLGIVIFWNLLILGKQYQEERFTRSLNDVPILLYSRLYDDLRDLQKDLESIEYIDRTEIQQDSLIAKELIEVYKLESAYEVLKNYNLPSTGQIYVIGSKFGFKEYRELQNLIFEKYRGISINYQDIVLQEMDETLHLLDRIFLILSIISIFSAIVVLTFFRVHFEFRNNNFWDVFFRSGGDPYKREKLFWRDTINLIFIPMILVTGGYWFLQYYQLLPYTIDVEFFAIEAGMLLLIALISRLIAGKKI